MIDLTKKGLPNTVMVDGRPYSIYTDFRVWLRFCIEFEKWNGKGCLYVSYIFKNDIPLHLDIESILEFAYPKTVIPNDTGSSSEEKVIDYEIDSDYIYSAFYDVYQIDLLEAEMHWYKFISLLKGLHDCKLSDIMQCRMYEGTDKDGIRLRETWALPIVLTEEDVKIKDEFDNYFDGAD
ncbi:Gp15 family bacteriophage protein [Lachnospiraceae bacterium LCP25S3_G4]